MDAIAASMICCFGHFCNSLLMLSNDLLKHINLQLRYACVSLDSNSSVAAEGAKAAARLAAIADYQLLYRLHHLAVVAIAVSYYIRVVLMVAALL